jgi:hypothetical protein
MSAGFATYQPEASGIFPTAFLLFVLILTAIGVIAHVAFV